MAKQFNKEKDSKLTTIINILNGTVSIDDLMPGRSFMVSLRQGIYTLESGFSGDVIKAMNKEEYEQWKTGNVRPKDKIFFCEYTVENQMKPYPGIDELNKAKESVSNGFKNMEFKDEVDTIPWIKKGRRKAKKVIEPEIITEPTNEVKRSGSLSSYGETWSFTEDTIQQLKPHPWRMR